ncbi:MAG: N-6 DNA methylase [Ruminococcus sp.]|nr:N-6 DNA methylase [Ruminococcus sp.]
MTEKEQKKSAKAFAERWNGKGYEKGESQLFWIDLLQNVYGVNNISEFITFEEQVKLDHTSFIDGYIDATHVMIEQKSIDKDLRKGIKQSDGTLLTPFQQAKRYASDLPYSKRPRWIVTCNFSEFLVYDMEKPNGEPEQIFLKDLSKDYYRLQFLVDNKNNDFQKEMQISIDAGKITEKLYNSLIQQYNNPDSVESLKSLNMLCVRLVFCFYAENSDIFVHNQFKHYMRDVPVDKWHRELKILFKILNTKPDDRDPYDDEKLNAFPYVNGGLFADENIEIPRFTEEIKDIIINQACGFDWRDISPTIFGAVFESTLNPETRRSGGMHYTSIENIHKVIDPLFLDDLKNELNEIKSLKVEKTRNQKLNDYRKKLSELMFLDPACGSGNFLTETYISLRRLENEALRVIYGGQKQFNIDDDLIKVGIHQFYGIEINDFAVTVAKTALWIAESQMMHETEEIIEHDLDFLPLKSYANIVEGNSLRIDWAEVVPKEKLSYIMGNPPFVGYKFQSKAQKEDMKNIAVDFENYGTLDYVSGWYIKASEYMLDTKICTAFVSTNSVSQGEHVTTLWKPLFNKGIHINFAHRSFIWDSEANLMAHVHCVIIGFSSCELQKDKIIFNNERFVKAKHINGYLLDAPDIFISKRNKPWFSATPTATKGNAGMDNGNLTITAEERTEILRREPELNAVIKRHMSADDFLNNKENYCFWLKDVSPVIYSRSKELQKRLKAVKDYRESSNRQATKKMAEYPMLFAEIRQPQTNYIMLPVVSSEKRKYIPIAFLTPDIINSYASISIPNATLYHFGVLCSNVHNAWMRAICGRLEMRYRYATSLVYNTFPWCTPTEEQKKKIEFTARAILDARNKYPDCSLAELYDELTMPPELRKAHQANDLAVMSAYGFDKKITESECVAELMKMYQKLTKEVKL